MPYLVILDLNMPGKDGREALREIRENNRTRHIPVIMMSTSHNEYDIKFTYKAGANTYFSKPSSFQELVVLCRRITDYWSSARW